MDGNRTGLRALGLIDRRAARAAFSLALALLLAVLVLLGMALLQPREAHAAGSLTVQIIAGYNLVVDSNAGSPSTFAPSAATVIGRFCNEGDAELTGVQGFIGDYLGSPSASTPGLYPARDSSGFTGEHPALVDTGVYSFTHVGGRAGLGDATRFIGTLAVGECKVQYWHIEYPQCSGSEAPPCSDVAVWGDLVKPEDDLWLQFDIWGTSDEGSNADATWTMHMRNEISAMANKIEPEGNPGGQWFNTISNTIRPGEVITSNGIRYELGNVRQGFDNDGDYQPDYNAWLQPIGDASYDPSCFRLIHTHGYLTVTRSGGLPTLIIEFDDREDPHPVYGGPLYFTDLPSDNTGVTGNVYYTFLALDGPCATALSPYQEVASGYDNEKFNGDYGIAIPPVGSLEPLVTIEKSGDITATSSGFITYTIHVSNTSSHSVGDPESSMPLVSVDGIPTGTTVVASSSSLPVTTRYWVESQGVYTTTPPSFDDVGEVQWWLAEALTGHTGFDITFVVQVDDSYPPLGGSPFIENCVDATFGAGTAFEQDCTVTMIEGAYSIGDRVWRDEDLDTLQDTGELSITQVTLSLYWDKDGDGELDSGDMWIKTTETGANGGYLFDKLAGADYLVVVDTQDAQIPQGYRRTTDVAYATTLSSTRTSDMNADFGFGPSLEVDKEFVGGSAYETNEVSYNITVRNLRAAGGETTATGCQYEVWSSARDDLHSESQANKQFSGEYYAYGAPDRQFAVTDLADADDTLAVTGFELAPREANIVSVTLVLYADEIALLAAGDTLVTTIYFTDTASAPVHTLYGSDFDGAIGQTDVFTFDITGNHPGAWKWSDLQNEVIDVVLLGSKVGGSQGDMGVDAVGLWVTTDGPCEAEDIDDALVTVPLTDTYNTTYLQFISAVPPESEIDTTNGVITWTNVGPLYPGESKTVHVTFLALELASAATVNNTACSIGSTFSDEGLANDDCVTATGRITPTGTITGIVFSDPDGDGWAFNGSEDYGIAGVTVYLSACVNVTTGNLVYPGSASQNCTGAQNNGTWQLIDTQVTGADGRYVFDGLLKGFYIVGVDASTLPKPATRTAEADDDQSVTTSPTADGHDCPTCNDVWGNSTLKLSTANFNPISDDNEKIYGVNFGYTVPAGIYGTVWQDHDKDGVQDSTDGGLDNNLAGITVTLTNSSGVPISTTQTASDGSYEFIGLAAGTYTITVDASTLPPGGTWTQTYDPDATCVPMPGAGCNDEHTVTISAGQISGSHDFGYHRSGTYRIGDTVYVDWNGDGSQDAAGGEEGISGVDVRLYVDSDGSGTLDVSIDALITTTTTDASGVYTFTGLVTGTYLVVVDTGDLPAWDDYQQTQDPDEDPGVCTVCNSRGLSTISSTLQVDEMVDFGYQPLGFGSIGDFVWEDLNKDGFQNVGEAGIPSITVSLYEDDGDGVYEVGVDALVMTRTTDASGYYLFEHLQLKHLTSGDYLVIVDTDDPDLPEDGDGNPYVLTTDNSPLPVTLALGQTYLDADFGFGAGGKIGDYIWQDDDGDGIQDAGEPGISGVTVSLYVDTDDDGVPDMLQDTAVTNSSGFYTFTGLISGTYRVVVDTTGPLAGFTLTGDPDKKTACSVPPATGCDSQSTIALGNGMINMTRDFGYQPARAIGDRVWWDTNDDGVQDEGELGIGGVVITLTRPSGGGIVTTTTDSDGFYSFGGGDLTGNGVFTIEVDFATLPSSQMTQTYDLNGPLDNRALMTISTANFITDVIDFGYRYDGDYSISGTIFFDAGDDGNYYTPGDGDLPYENITVYLYDNAKRLIGTATTGSDGQYLFSNLPGGGMTYTVSVAVASPKLENTTMTAMPDTMPGMCSGSSCKNYTTVTITSTNVTDRDFGFFSSMDYGDLPDTLIDPTEYGVRLADEGPRHVIGDHYLGSGPPDADGDGRPEAQAGYSTGGDDFTGSADEDGVVRNENDYWTNGNTVYLTVTAHGDSAYLVGWFDWNVDGDFAEANEMVVFGSVVSGTSSVSLQVPAVGSYLVGDDIYVRFRLYEGQPLLASSTGLADNGEVEDYYWPFGPTSVTLAGFRAQGGPVWWAVALALLLVAGLAGFVLVARRRPWRRVSV